MLKQHLICWGHCTQQWPPSGGLCLEHLGTEWGGLLSSHGWWARVRLQRYLLRGNRHLRKRNRGSRGLQMRKSRCEVEEQVWVARGRRYSWKGDEDPVAKKHVKEPGVRLEEIGVIRGHSVPCWDGNDLKARAPKAGSCSGPTRGQSSSEMGTISSEMGTSSD